MHTESQEPVRALRARVAEERDILEGLGRKFNHQSMKERVRLALAYLDDVEAIFLGTLDKGARTAPQEAEVIRNAHLPYGLAVGMRKYFQELMATYGVHAMLGP